MHPQTNALIRQDAKHRHERQYAADPQTHSCFGALMPDLYTSQQPFGDASVLCTFEVEPEQKADETTEPFPENVILRTVLINGEEVNASADHFSADWLRDTEQRILEERRAS